MLLYKTTEMSKGMIFFMNLPELQIRIKLLDHKAFLFSFTTEFCMGVMYIEFYFSILKNSKIESGNSLLLILEK